MNESIISQGDRRVMRKDVPRSKRPRREERNDHCYFFSMQRFDEYIQGVVSSTVKARDYKDVTDIVVEEPKTKMKRKYLARRLTPTECLSLQGLPKWWCDGVKGWSASRVYQLAGNGLALPCAIDVLGRIVDYEERTRDGN